MTVQTSSLKQRQREERERLIVQATAEVLVEKGYDAMSMEEVANRVGISRAAIYLHFPSKEDLVYALLEYAVKTSRERLETLLVQSISPREKVRLLIERTCGGMAEPLHRVFSTILQSPTFMNNLAGKRPNMHELWRPTMQLLAAILDEGKRAGEFDPEMPTSLMATLLSGLLTPWVYKSAVEQEGMPLPLVASCLSRYFLKGIAAEHPCDAQSSLSEAPAPRRETNQTTAVDK